MHLRERRGAILAAWRAAVQADPALSTASTLRRGQFYDHIPIVLDALERELRGESTEVLERTSATEAKAAIQHGTVRWQQGYQLAEVVREWALLSACLLDELKALADTTLLSAAVLLSAQCVVARVCHEGVGKAAVEYQRLEEVAASGKLADLEHALAQLRDIEQERARLWHEAAHDLRGNVGVVRNAAAILDRHQIEGDQRHSPLRLLRSGLDSLTALLEDLMQLARLEAGREQRIVQPFDAAQVLTELASALQPLAEARRLFLRTEGPPAFAVTGDAVKTRRIAQNLLLNALRYTTDGGVVVKWSASDSREARTWSFAVLDTGPGIPDGGAPPITHALKEATDEGRAVVPSEAIPSAEAVSPPPTLLARSDKRDPLGMPGEGVGLSIVKRLCELLDATLELDSAPGRGTTVRVTLPLVPE